MQRQLPDGDLVAAAGLADQLLGQGAVFLARDHPGQGKPAEQVQHNIQRQVDAASDQWQLRDVPCPDLIGLSSLQARYRVVLSGPLVASLAATALST